MFDENTALRYGSGGWNPIAQQIGKVMRLPQSEEELLVYFSGEKLYGDDFTQEQIQKWYSDEAEGYAGLGAKERTKYAYSYHQLNERHAFRLIRRRSFDRALGIGSAYGDEFRPIIRDIKQVVILDPSESFSGAADIGGIPCKFIKPSPDGTMPFDDDHFDLVTCLGVLHHIPNVRYVMGECYRCLRKGGIMLLREPIVSMGNWTKPRPGLTMRERGIPLHIMDDMVRNTGFAVKHRSLCNFPVIQMMANRAGVAAYNNAVLTMIDEFLSRIFSWNIKYHRTTWHEKIAPAAAYYVLEKSLCVDGG